MKNGIIRMIKKGLLGGLIGLTMSHFITIAISLCLGDGAFHPVVPDLIIITKTEIAAVCWQTVMSLFMGIVIGLSTLVWEKDQWSLTKQTIVHFVMICIAVFPVAWFCRWMTHTTTGVLLYVGEVVGVYILIWIGLYFTGLNKVKKINEKITKR